MDRIIIKSIKYILPLLQDEPNGRFALQRAWGRALSIGPQIIFQMCAQFVTRGVMEVTNRGVLEGSAHPLNLSAGPGIKQSRQAILNVMPVTHGIDQVGLIRLCALPLGELWAIVRQHSVNPAWQLPQCVFEKLGCLFPLRLALEPGKDKFGGPVNGD